MQVDTYSYPSLAGLSPSFLTHQNASNGTKTYSYYADQHVGTISYPIFRQVPRLPNELVHYILILAASHHPSTHPSLRLTSSWVRAMCQQYMTVAVIIKTHAEAMEFGNFMAWQSQWGFRAPFKVDAIWFQHEAFKTEEEASVVPYILDKCPKVWNVAVSVTVYVVLARCETLDTSKISKLTVLGNDIIYTPYHLTQSYHSDQLHPSHIFRHITHLVLYNTRDLEKLSFVRYPNVTHVAVCHYDRDPDLEETGWILDRIRSAPHLKRFVMIFYREFKEALVKWTRECRKVETRLYIVESTIATDRLQNDIKWWRYDATHERTIWERAIDYTATIENQ